MIYVQHDLVNMVEECYEKLDKFDVYRVSNRLLFAFGAKETLVATSLELYTIKYYHRNYKNQFMNLREYVKCGGIQTIVDLIDYCKLRCGKNSQMYGLELVTTKLERHI